MKTSIKTIFKLTFASAALFAMSTLTSCEKDKRTPPNLTLVSGTGFITTDTTFTKGTFCSVSLHAEKTEDELKTLNVSYAYDGATTTTTKDTYTMGSESEKKDYKKDYSFFLRNQAGTEEWSFTVTDRDGNVTTKKIKIIVTP